jgi:PIN domain nuclease of toxin-antitoxin system
MKLLLDTHSLIWFLNGDEKLSVKVKDAIENSGNVKFVSVASVWEIAIKISLDKFRFSKGFKHFLTLIEENGFGMMPITMEHALILSTLEFIHRDPFDRLLISQCKADNLVLATKDENIKKYQIQTIW